MKTRSKLLLAGAVLATVALAAQAQVPGVNSTLQTVFTLAYDNSTMKPTYSSTVDIVPASAFVGGATDVCTIFGSATKNVRVRRIIISGVASVVQTEVIGIVKRSTIDSGGTQTLGTAVPYDSGSPAATAVIENFTANPTLGTLVGALADFHITWGNLTTGVGSPPTVVTFGALGSPAVLRGTSQQLAVNLNANSLVSGKVACTFEWTEE